VNVNLKFGLVFIALFGFSVASSEEPFDESGVVKTKDVLPAIHFDAPSRPIKPE